MTQSLEHKPVLKSNFWYPYFLHLYWAVTDIYLSLTNLRTTTIDNYYLTANGYLQYYTENLSEYSSLQVSPKKESKTLKEKIMLASRKSVLPQGSSSIHLSFPPHSATAPIAHKDSLVTMQPGCHLILQDKTMKQNSRVIDISMLYSCLEGMMYFF